VSAVDGVVVGRDANGLQPRALGQENDARPDSSTSIPPPDATTTTREVRV